jgi:hypothetical protein
MGGNQTPDAEAEMRNALRASVDVEATGTTPRRCLRCGGELSMRTAGSSCEIVCATEDLVILTSRGI